MKSCINESDSEEHDWEFVFEAQVHIYSDNILNGKLYPIEKKHQRDRQKSCQKCHISKGKRRNATWLLYHPI